VNHLKLRRSHAVRIDDQMFNSGILLCCGTDNQCLILWPQAAVEGCQLFRRCRRRSRHLPKGGDRCFCPGGDIVQNTGLHGLEPQPLALCGLVRAALIPAALTIGKCARSEDPVLMRG
jgi:hypothetical protein